LATITRAYAESSDDEEKQIDLHEYIGYILEGWRWLAALTLAGILIACYLGWRQAPVYKATALMRVEPSQNLAPQALILQETSNNSSSGVDAVSAEAAVIHSRSVAGAVVDKLHLRVSAHPRYAPAIGEAFARLHAAFGTGTIQIPGLSAYAWGNETIHVTRIKLPQGVAAANFTLTARPAGHYRVRDSHGQPVLSGQVGQTASGHAPGLGPVELFVASLHAAPGTQFQVHYAPRPAAIANLLSRLQIDEKPKGSGLLDLSLTAASPARAQRQLNAIMGAYMQQNVEKQSEQAQHRLDFLKKQLPQLKQKGDIAERKLRQYQTKSGTLDLSSEAQSILQRLTNIDQKIAETEIKRQDLLQTYTPRYPRVQALDKQKATLKKQRRALTRQLKKLPESESRLLELRRHVEVNNQLYTKLLNTSQGLAVSKAGITGVSHIVDHAYASPGKIAPKRMRIAIVGLLAGLVAGVLLVLTRALLRIAIDDPDILESKYGLPVYATVPYSTWEHTIKRRKRGFNLLAIHGSDEPAVESIRSLRTSLQFAMIEGATKSIAITSPTPNSGKSFIALNISALLAQTGLQVLAIDADLRRGTVHQTLKLPQEPGLSNVLAGEIGVQQAIQRSPINNLDVLTTGKRPPNPAELLVSHRLADMQAALQGTYDYVVFDLPPALNVTDASIVAQHAGATFLVVRSEHTTGPEVQDAVRRLERAEIKVTGAIFNGLKVNRLRYGKARYGYYAYKYKPWS
jgi:tyrosine-protein kinase Etk/Wzc